MTWNPAERRSAGCRRSADYLRDHLLVAREYQALTRALASHVGAADAAAREAYAGAKTTFVTAVTQRALTLGYQAKLS